VLHKAGEIVDGALAPGHRGRRFLDPASDMPGLDADPNAATEDGKAASPLSARRRRGWT
jgi:hypothetical protein